MNSLSRRRVYLLGVTAGFIVTVIFYYLDYLVPIWGYQGFNEFDLEKSSISLGLAVTFLLVFSSVYPIDIKNYSRFVVWTLFYLLYLPSVIIVAMSGIPEDGGATLVTCLSISLWLIAFIPEILIAWRPYAFQITQNFSSQVFLSQGTNIKLKSPYDVHMLIFASIFILSVFVYYFEILRFFSIEDIYLQREIAADYAPSRSLFSYAEQWTNRLIAPFLLAIGLIYKNRTAVIVALLGFLLTFLISGSKYSLFSPLLMIFLYRYVVSKRQFSGLQIGAFFWAALALPVVVVQFYGSSVSDFFGLFLSQILKRAYAAGGMTLGNYYDFFTSNPYTYYSHIGPVRLFADYPFGNFSIGQVVGHFQSGTYSYNMSANFWATDGIAAAGYAGLIAIGAVLGAILSVFNKFTKPKHLVLVCLSSVGCIQMLADTSVFRVLLSGGWPLHFLLVFLYSRRLYLKKGQIGLQ